MIVKLSKRHFCEKPGNGYSSENLSGQNAGSFILYEKARYYHWAGEGQLSLKTFTGGEVRYSLKKAGEFLLDHNSYLILNHGQPYTITIDMPRPVESLCLFFEKGLAEEIYRSLNASHSNLLDTPDRTDTLPGTSLPASQSFFERSYPHDPVLFSHLNTLRTFLNTNPGLCQEQSFLVEQLNLIMMRLIRLQYGLYSEVDTIKAVRVGTRLELYRRLHLARDYIRALYDQPLTLDDLAQVACLSPNHLLRTFRQLFGQTPYQYLSSYHLEKACELLAQTRVSITTISLKVGFESTGSFSWWFKSRTGVSPAAYRISKGQKGDFEEVSF